MHVASGLILVGRESVQSDVAAPRGRRAPGPAPFQSQQHADPTRARLRKILPGAILLTVLALIGGLVPLIF